MRKKNEGITLVALVVTIIVLIILAAVSISLILGENGIITKTKYAKQEMLNAQIKEQEQLNEVASYLENMEETEIDLSKLKTVEELKGEDYFDKKTTVKDSNGNLIEIPEGFKIAEDSGTNVTEGIVIEDNDIKRDGKGENRGNQYVWIPVGKGIRKSENEIVDIILGRYIFANGTEHKDEEGNVLTKGTPILMQNAENYANETEINIGDDVHKELKIYNSGIASSGLDGKNATALDLKAFIDSVEENGGYYIARYEASYGEDGKVNSKISTAKPPSSDAAKTEGMVWNYITQIDAAIACKKINEDNNNYTVDLINSYAWDTATVYIQKFSEDIDYSYQTSLNSSLNNTGLNGDEVCKINDMASNVPEWTTEYSSATAADGSARAIPCVSRGGYAGWYYCWTSARLSNSATSKYEGNGFRAVLYL